MAPKHYENMRDASLYEYITPDIVRTISKEQRDIPGGVTEIPLEIQLKKKSMKKLSFNVPWDGSRKRNTPGENRAYISD